MELYTNAVLKTLQERGKEYPDRKALFDHRGRFITSTELSRYIDSVALELVDRGIRRGDRVIFLAQASIESIIYFLALSRAGAVIVLVDPEMGDRNFHDRVTFSEAKWIIQDPILEKIETYSFIKPILRYFHIWFPEIFLIEKSHKITLRSLHQIKSITARTFTEETITDSEDMTIIFTSGTTGTPKGVVHSYRSLVAGIQLICSELPIQKDDCFYASQFYFLLIALAVPCQVFIPKPKKFNPQSFIKALKNNKITSAFLLPSEGQKVYEYCISHNQTLPSSLRTIFFGSAPVTRSFLDKIASIAVSGISLYGLYGATEMLIISLVSAHQKKNYTGRGDLLGMPLSSVKISIMKDDEVTIAGPQMYDRYLGDTEKAKWFYSGDLGAVDAQGNIVMLGRKKDMIIKNGFNIYPGLFEPVISSIPGIKECALVGRYDEKIENEIVTLFLVKEEGATLSTNTIKNYLESGTYSIDRYAIPDTIEFLSELPRYGRSKKVDKNKLKTWQKI